MKSAVRSLQADGQPLDENQRPCFVPLTEAKSHAFIASHYRERAFHFVWHFHEELELVWIRQGRGLRYVDGQVEAFKEGDLVLLGGGLPHTWASAHDWRDTCEWTVLQLQPELWGTAFWQLPELQDLRGLFDEAGRGVQFLGQKRWEVGRHMEALTHRPPYTLEAAVGLLDVFRRLLALPRRLLNPPSVSPGMERDTRLEGLLALIRRRATERLTQEECARSLRMSPAAFSRWFKTRTGRTFQCYLNELRVANVCAHLAKGKENVTQAAFACGYGCLANFYRRFREVTGLSPSEFCSLTRHSREQRVRELIIRHGRHSAVRILRLPSPSSLAPVARPAGSKPPPDMGEGQPKQNLDRG